MTDTTPATIGADAERAAFQQALEAIATDAGEPGSMDFRLHADGGYENDFTEVAWRVWQARAALASAAQPAANSDDPAEPRGDSDRTYDRPIGYLPASELGRLHAGHDASLRSARFGPSDLDGDVPVYLDAAFAVTPKAAPAPAAQGDALPREDFAWLVVHEACETEPADDDDPECIRILRRDLKSAVLAALLRYDASARAAKEGCTT